MSNNVLSNRAIGWKRAVCVSLVKTDDCREYKAPHFIDIPASKLNATKGGRIELQQRQESMSSERFEQGVWKRIQEFYTTKNMRHSTKPQFCLSPQITIKGWFI